MAVAQLNLSRRALLGAAFAAPILSAVAGRGGEGHILSRHAGLDPASTFFSLPPQGRWTPDQVRGDEGAWDRARARFQKADTALAALAHTPDEDRPLILSSIEPVEMRPSKDRAGTRHDRALVRLLRTPAPHAAALAGKTCPEPGRRVDLLIAHQSWEFRAGDACLAALSADSRRLASAAHDRR